MANNNNPEATFWDSFQPWAHRGRGAGAGVDHMFASYPTTPHGFPLPPHFSEWPGNGQWAPWGDPAGRPWGHDRRGRQHGPSASAEEQHPDDNPSDIMRATPESAESPSDAETHPPGGPHPPPPPHSHQPPPYGFPHHPFGPGPRRGRGGHCERGRGGHRGRPGPPPPPFTDPLNLRPLMQAFASHPIAQAVRDYVGQAAAGSSDEQHEDKFVPPVDIFSTEKAYILHFALPGASKEDIGVHWDPEKSTITVGGVVYRPGNEELLQSMVSSERKVGVFERSIELPPAGSDKKEEVDGFGITAKMDNGILLVTVPKVEKDSWTEIHKIDVD